MEEINMDDQDSRRALFALGAIAVVLLSGMLLFASMIEDEQAYSREQNEKYEMQAALIRAEGKIGHELARMDGIVSDGAAGIGKDEFSEASTLEILSGMNNSGPWVIDAITTDINGKIVLVQPESYKSVIGADISNQTHLKKLFLQKTPVMSDLFMTVEGVPAIDIASPVFSPEGRFIGATTLLYNPDELFRRFTPLKADGTPWHIWVMQKDGTVLYDPDPGQRGKNIFTDQLYAPYPDLIELSKEIAAERQGRGTYTFIEGTGGVVRKDAVWTTIGIRGTEWRLIIVRIPNPPYI
jgi:hypothetical protein